MPENPFAAKAEEILLKMEGKTLDREYVNTRIAAAQVQATMAVFWELKVLNSREDPS